MNTNFTATLNVGTWYHTAFVRHDNTVRVYLNNDLWLGPLEGLVSPITTGTTGITLGSAADGQSWPFRGYIDDFQRGWCLSHSGTPLWRCIVDGRALVDIPTAALTL